MGHEAKPNSAVEKSKYFNKMDEAFGLLFLSMSSVIHFHIAYFKTLNEVWTTLEGLFGKHDMSRGHQLENKVIVVSPGNFNTIQDFFTKIKSLLF
jgi:hypothetical protein